MSPTIAVAFSERMRGGFAVGASEAAAGAREGGQSGSYLTLQAVATIDDVPSFVRSPAHAGRLSGTVTFPAVGAEATACQGTFALFVPGQEPGLKRMTYRAAFRAAGASYCLDGEKFVGRQSLLGAWTDTTTLHCRLHRGEDVTGPVVAAGVLHLGPLAFLRQLASFRTPGTVGLARLKALAGFLIFFSGELIDTYILRR